MKQSILKTESGGWCCVVVLFWAFEFLEVKKRHKKSDDAVLLKCREGRVNVDLLFVYIVGRPLSRIGYGPQR